MQLSSVAHRFVATVLAMAMLASSLGVARAGCNDECPCCQSHKLGSSEGCCHAENQATDHERADSGCCQHRAANSKCCSQKATQQTSEQAKTPLCLCGAAEHEPVMVTAIAVRAPDLTTSVFDLPCDAGPFFAIDAAPCFVAAHRHAGFDTALEMRAVLCCWRI